MKETQRYSFKINHEKICNRDSSDQAVLLEEYKMLRDEMNSETTQ